MGKGMKILVVDTGSKFNGFGGQQRIAALLYRDLAKSNEVYYLGYPTDYIRENDKGNALFLSGASESIRELRKSKLSENGAVRMVYNLVFNRMMMGLDRSEIAVSVSAIMPDLIIANSISDFALLAYLRRRGIKFKSIYIDHGSLSTTTSSYLSKESIPLTFGSGINSITLEGAKRKFFNFFDMNVALNVKQEKEILQLTDKVTRISNGIKINTKVSLADASKLKKKYSLTGKEFVTIYIGRLFERQKRVSTLITAFKSIKSPNARLLLVGSGPSLPDYKELAGGDRRIQFCGPLSGKDVATAYSISNLFVLASAWEGLTLTTLEAFQFGLPVILSEDSYSADLKLGGASLLNFPTGDSQRLASLIESVMKDEKVRKKAVAASNKLSKEFSEEKMIKSYEDLVESL
jgi:glycosyltransferase involved in cell wall biosynthesis